MKAIILILFLLFAGCKQEEDIVRDANGVVTKLSHTWDRSISNNGQLAEIVNKTQIVYDQRNILVGMNKDGKSMLGSLNNDTGTLNWVWDGMVASINNPTFVDQLSIGEEKYHVYDNKLVFIWGANTYCVNLSTGKTQWLNQLQISRFPRCSGYNGLYFYGSPTKNYLEGESLWAGSMSGGVSDEFIVYPAYDFLDADKSSPYQGGISEILPFEQGGNLLLAVLFGDPGKTNNRFPTNMGLYNLSQRKWVYERTPLNGSYPNSNVSWAKLYNGKVYHTSTRSMLCHDVMTGKEIWSANFDQGFASSGFTIQEGKIFANNGDRYTYCLNPETGRQIWKEESSGSASPISYLNGVLYFMGGGDGRLHAIDANTGKHLWRLRSPDVDKNSGAFFYGTCVAVPGQGGKKGRVVATTGLNAYGYEAIR